MGGIQNPSGAFGYPEPDRVPDNEGDYVAASAVTKGNVVQISATLTNGRIIPALTNGDTPAIVGIALNDAAAGESVKVARGGFCDAVKDASVTVTAGDVVQRSATTVGQIISAAAASTLPGVNLGYIIIGATNVAGTVRIFYNQV